MVTPTDRLKLAALILTSERTVYRTYRGEPVATTTHARVSAGAQQLGLPMPPPAASNAQKAA